MKILTAEEMGAADRRTGEGFGVPLELLMENAGHAVAAFCMRQYGAASPVAVLCGKGNKGGDGFVAARALAQAGQTVRVVLLGRPNEVKGEAGTALKRPQTEGSNGMVDEGADDVAVSACAPVLGGA